MADYKFWKTQPVPQFNEVGPAHSDQNGPIVDIEPAKTSREPIPLIDGYGWADLDLRTDTNVTELYELLKNHYVEDEDAEFQFCYSPGSLQWALQPPGWKSSWHIGMRESSTSNLVACITAVPMTLRVQGRDLKMPFVNFLCVHKELRFKRLTPVLVQEIARRCSRDGFQHAFYTSGDVLPKPVSVASYYHRTLNWAKMIEIDFVALSPASTVEKEAARHALPEETGVPGLRPMVDTDVPTVHVLLNRYLERFELAPVLSEDEVRHYLLPKTNTTGVPVVYTYVVEDAASHAITDVISFYTISSSCLKSTKHETYLAAYSSYYASTAAWEEGENLKERLVSLQRDALILATKAGCDVFNSLTIADDPLFLKELDFGAGTGRLNYYFYNYRAALVPGGINYIGHADENMTRGIGMITM